MNPKRGEVDDWQLVNKKGRGKPNYSRGGGGGGGGGRGERNVNDYNGNAVEVKVIWLHVSGSLYHYLVRYGDKFSVNSLLLFFSSSDGANETTNEIGMKLRELGAPLKTRNTYKEKAPRAPGKPRRPVWIAFDLKEHVDDDEWLNELVDKINVAQMSLGNSERFSNVSIGGGVVGQSNWTRHQCYLAWYRNAPVSFGGNGEDNTIVRNGGTILFTRNSGRFEILVARTSENVVKVIGGKLHPYFDVSARHGAMREVCEELCNAYSLNNLLAWSSLSLAEADFYRSGFCQLNVTIVNDSVTFLLFVPHIESNTLNSYLDSRATNDTRTLFALGLEHRELSHFDWISIDEFSALQESDFVPSSYNAWRNVKNKVCELLHSVTEEQVNQWNR